MSNARKTAPEFVTYFASLTRAEQEKIAEQILRNNDEASRCWMEDHAHLRDENRALHLRLARYKIAWRSARWRARRKVEPDFLTTHILSGRVFREGS